METIWSTKVISSQFFLWMKSFDESNKGESYDKNYSKLKVYIYIYICFVRELTYRFSTNKKYYSRLNITFASL